MVGDTVNPNGVFAQTEYPALLNNSRVTTIEGLPLKDLKPEDIEALIDYANVRCMGMNLPAENPDDLFAWKNMTDEDVSSDKFIANVNKYAENYTADELASKSRLFSKVGRGLGLAGKGLLALSFIFVSLEAAEASEAGNEEQAAEIMKVWASENVGSEVASAVAGMLTTMAIGALAAGGVVISAPVAGAMILGATIIGGLLGENVGKQIYELTKDLDENGKRDFIDRLSNLLFVGEEGLPKRLPEGYDGSGTKFNMTVRLSVDELVANAKDNVAWRYALRELNHFVLEGADYSKHEVDLSDLPEDYLYYRAKMLKWRMEYIINGISYSHQLNVEDAKGAWESLEGNWDFIDMGLRYDGNENMKLEIDGYGLSRYDHQIVFGSRGDDDIEGSGDFDFLYGDGGNDSIDAGGGDDKIYGGLGDDELLGGVGADELYGDSGEDSIWGDAGTDIIYGGTASDHIYGGDGADYINGDDGNDNDLYGGAGGDEIHGGNGEDTLYGEDGDDVLFGGEGADTIYGGGGQNYLLGDAGNDTLMGGAERDEMWGGSGDDTFQGNSGNDGMEGEAGNDTLYGGDGHDFIHGGADNDTIYGDGASPDSGEAKPEASYYLGTVPMDDTLVGGDGSDNINGGAGNDLLIGYDGENLDDIDNINPWFGDLYDFKFYNDDGQNDILIGGAGRDIITAGSGDDVLVGYDFHGDDYNKNNEYSSVDILMGGRGRNIYYAGKGDIIYDGDGSGEIWVYIESEGRHVRLEGPTHKDGIKRVGKYGEIYATNGDSLAIIIDGLEFSPNELGYGIGVRNFEEGMFGFYLDDFSKNGRKPKELRMGTSGTDIVHGTTGDDEIIGFGGNDELNGMSGDDTYAMARGYGVDTINEMTGYDTISFGDNISKDDLYAWYEGNDLFIGLKEDAGADAMKIKNYAYSEIYKLEELQFADGSTAKLGDILEELLAATPPPPVHQVLVGTDEAETLESSYGNDTIIGKKGDDTLVGDRGDDKYIFKRGDGKDSIVDVSGFDTIAYKGISQGDICARREGDDLVLAIREDGVTDFDLLSDSIHIKDYFTTGKIENIIFNDKHVNLEDILPTLWTDVDPDGGTGTDNARISPIILDLDGNTANDLIKLEGSNAYFRIKDWDVWNTANRTGWVSATDGLLAWDRNKNGTIDDITELFGNNKQADGFDALSYYFDSNKDGVVNKADDNFNDLKIWVDADSDGITDAGELKSFADLGIASINTGHSQNNGRKEGDTIASGSYTKEDGTTGKANDYLFGVSMKDNVYKDKYTITEDIIRIFTNFNGWGGMPDLHVAMAADRSLYDFVSDRMTDMNSIVENFDNFMLKWSGLAAKHAELGINTNGTLRFIDIMWIIEQRTDSANVTDEELILGDSMDECYPVPQNTAIYEETKWRYFSIIHALFTYDGVVYSEPQDRILERVNIKLHQIS